MGVLDQMTLEEQNNLLHGSRFTFSGPEPGFYVGNTPAIRRLGVPALKMQDASGGFRMTLDFAMHTVTAWPSMLSMAATWDENLLEFVAAGIGQEFRGKGANVILGPSINVHRSALAGRNFEYLSGEDPYLGARMTAAYVRGVQSEGVMAVAKHFAFNEQETNRMTESSEVDQRTAWELYYPPFEAAVAAGAGAFMCAYNKINGSYACENDLTLKRDLKGSMNFQGFVMSDWMATHTPKALQHGLDQEQPLGLALNDITLMATPADIRKESVLRVLTSIYALRLDQQESCEPPCWRELLSDQRSEAHSALARQAATSSVVLLKNKGVLPINVQRVRKLAILGSAADAKAADSMAGDYYSGGGSGYVAAGEVETPLGALRQRLTSMGVEVTNYTGTVVEDALQVAADADLVVVVAATTSCEGGDRASLALDNDADTLISKVAAVKPTVVLMQIPGAVLTPWREEVAAIAAMFLGGSQTAAAWASVLTGEAPPSGKLPIMLPATPSDVILPNPEAEVPYSEGLLTSYRSPHLKAAFPFGHGLSFTTFQYGRAEHVTKDCRAKVCVRMRVTNVGSTAGHEVAQAYLHFPRAPQGTPEQVLRGFAKTKLLAPKESQDLLFAFSERDLSHFDVRRGWVLHAAAEVRVGSSSADIRQKLYLQSLHH